MSPNSPYRNNNQHNDPYAKRDSYANKDVYAKKDPWANKNAYKVDDPYKAHDPYEKNEYDEKENAKPCSFWFTCKLKMQDIFSTDSGAQSEGRVFSTDTDPFILGFMIKLSILSFANFFTVPLVMTILFVLSIYANPEMHLILIVIEFFYIAYILYCPAWQTFTSSQYAVTETGESFYDKWIKGYRGYEGSTIAAFVLSVLTIGALAEYHFVFDIIHNYFGFSMVPEPQFKKAVYYVVIPSAIYLVLYFVLGRVLRVKDKAAKRKNKLINIDMRHKSILGQLHHIMDSAD